MEKTCAREESIERYQFSERYRNTHSDQNKKCHHRNNRNKDRERICEQSGRNRYQDSDSHHEQDKRSGNNERDNNQTQHSRYERINENRYRHNEHLRNKHREKSVELIENWYIQYAEKRLVQISEAVKKRNIEAKKFYESSNHYDELKRSFYNATGDAYGEGDISLVEKEEFLSKIRKIDKQNLEELIEVKRRRMKR